MSVVPNKAKRLLLILKGTRLFITEVIYLSGTCFRGILRKGLCFPLCDLFLGSRLDSSTKWGCQTDRCTEGRRESTWPLPHPRDSGKRGRQAPPPLALPWALRTLRRITAASLGSATASSPETQSELSKGQSQMLWHPPREQETGWRLGPCRGAPEFEKSSLAGTLGQGGCSCSVSHASVRRRVSGGSKPAEHGLQGVWGSISVQAHVCLGDGGRAITPHGRGFQAH